MFDIESCEWLLSDSSDPLAGWALDDILTSEARRGGPKEDIYGLMHLHVRHLLETFCRKTALLKVHMHLYCLDATKLPLVLEPRLKQSGFDRIEVANIADEDYIGLDASLSTFGPLLKSPMSNPHATLITLIMNTVNQAARDLVLDVDIQNTYIPKVTQFLGYRPSQKADLNDPETLRFLTAIDLVRDYKKIWDQYEQREDFPTMVKKKSMKAKLKNTVVEPWPMRLYKEPREPGAQEAFNRLMESGSMGSEHYIEWVRSE